MEQAVAGTSFFWTKKLQERTAFLIFAIFVSLAFALAFIPYAYQAGDIALHIEYAKKIHQFSDISSPHFLLQILLIGVNGATGIGYEAATILIMALCYGGMAVIVAKRLRRVAPQVKLAGVFAVSASVLVASHIFLQTAFAHNFYYGYVSPVVYHNPTQTLCKIFSVLIIYAYFALSFDKRRNAALLVILPLAIVLSALAKPSFLIVFLPCAFAVEIARATRSSWKEVARPLALFVLPALIVLAFQYQMNFSSSGAGIGFSPFKVFGGAKDVLLKFPASTFFPVIAAAVLYRVGGFTKKLAFAWFLYGVGMFVGFCIVETGPRLMHGNFAWTAQVVTFVLYIESAISLAAIEWERVSPAWCAFGLHVIFGAIWFATPYFMLVGTYW
jgi:hypothetical protein